MSLAFESATRTGSGETFCKLRDDSPEWMTGVCRAAHDEARLLPDDWRYIFIEEAIDALADHEDTDEAASRLEPDMFTRQLTSWLDSHKSRVSYLGEALAEYGSFRDGFQLLAAGQMIEKVEAFQQVGAALRKILETDTIAGD